MTVSTDERRDKVAVQEGDACELPLKHLTYRASVNGARTRVRCTQQFTNDASVSIEAVYCFPIPDDAAVIGCTMVIGERRIQAELKEKEAARQDYDAAVSNGDHAALVEQQAPNIFTMNVGGIEPGETIEVTVDYVQRVPWQAAGGRFTLPLVVAPRFVPIGQSPDGASPLVAPDGVPYRADVRVLFTPGFDCRVESPSHSGLIGPIEVAAAGTEEFATGNIVPDRDFILTYQSTSVVPVVAAHCGEFDGEQFMQVAIMPPGNLPAVATDFALVLDISSSMRGPKMAGLQQVAKLTLAQLSRHHPGNRVTIIPFNHAVQRAHPLGELDDDADLFIAGLEAFGSTELGPALTAAHEALPDADRPRMILLITDGQTRSLDYTGDGVPMVVVGIDSATDDAVIKQLAADSNGTCEFVHPGEDYGAVAARLAGYLSGPVLREVVVEAAGAEVVGVSDVYAGRPAVITARFRGDLQPIAITGRGGGQLQRWTISPTMAREHDYVPQLWARDHLREHRERVGQIAASLRYGVACQHTSFVAISEKESGTAGQPERVEIPVNLPAGWDFGAVFGAPEIRARGAARVRAISLTARPRDDGPMLCAGYGPIGSNQDDDEPEGSILMACTDFGSDLEADGLETEWVGGYHDPPERFALLGDDPVSCLGAVLRALGGTGDGADRAFRRVARTLSVDEVGRLHELDRAMVYYFATRLATYGLRFLEGVMNALREPPEGEEALAWYHLARKVEGRDHTVPDTVPGDASAYILWQFGRGERPVAGDWVDIP